MRGTMKISCEKRLKPSGKKQLIIAGVVTEVCVAFPALSRFGRRL